MAADGSTREGVTFESKIVQTHHQSGKPLKLVVAHHLPSSSAAAGELYNKGGTSSGSTLPLDAARAADRPAPLLPVQCLRTTTLITRTPVVA